MLTALAAALNQVTVFRMPQGGSVTACSMMFIALAGYGLGPVTGFMAGISAGLLDLFFGGYVVHPAQLILDYPLAFAMVGLMGGIFGLKNFQAGKINLNLQLGFSLGMMARFVCHLISGAIFFGAYAPEGQNPVVYSAVYNVTYILPEMLFTLVLLSVPAYRAAVDTVLRPKGARAA